MEISFSVGVDENNIPAIFLLSNSNGKNISIPVEIGSIITIIPNEILINYKNLLTNKLIELISIGQEGPYIRYMSAIKLINDYLNLQEGL